MSTSRYGGVVKGVHGGGGATFVQQRSLENFNTSATPATFYKEIGAQFAPGDVPSNAVVEWRKGNGTTVVPSQADDYATWQTGECAAPDVGSLRSASFTLHYPSQLAANGGADSDTLKAYRKNGAWNNTPWTANTAITSRDIRAEITVATMTTQQIGTGDGTTKTFSGTLAGAPAQPNIMSVVHTSPPPTGPNYDDGAGTFGTDGGVTSSSINYSSGAVTVTFGTAPAIGVAVTITYSKTSDAGTTYTLRANNEVTRNTLIEQMRSGLLHCGWRIPGVFRNGININDTDEGDLNGVMYLSFFDDGSVQADCRLFSSRGDNSTAETKLIIFYQLKDYSSPTVFFSRNIPFVFYAGTFVDCCNQDGVEGFTGNLADKALVSFPDPVAGDATTTGLYDSKTTWWIKWTAAEVTAMNASTPPTINYTPLANGETGYWDAAGASWFIGHMTMRAVRSWAQKTWAAFRQDRINAFAGATGRLWFPNSTTGYPMNLNGPAATTPYAGLGTCQPNVGWGVQPSMTITGGAVPVTGGTQANDPTHAGQWAWWQLLSTGKRKWLDHCHMEMIGFIGSANPQNGDATTAPATRNPLINSIQVYASRGSDAARSMAWDLRNRDNCEWATPDAHPMKAYLGDLLTNLVVTDWNQRFIAPYNTAPGGNPLGMPMTKWTSGANNFLPNKNAAVLGWQHSYMGIQMPMSMWRGRTDLSNQAMALHLTNFIIGRAYNGCPYWACSDELSVGDNTGQGWGGPLAITGTGGSYAGIEVPYATSWDKVSCGFFTNPVPQNVTVSMLVLTAPIAIGDTVINVDSTSGVFGNNNIPYTIRDTESVLNTKSNITCFGTLDTRIVSHTATTITVSDPATATAPTGAQIYIYLWFATNNPVGCPVSGTQPQTPCDGPHAYPNLLRCAAVACQTVGITGASSVSTYYANEVVNQGLMTETIWASLPQWRISLLGVGP